MLIRQNAWRTPLLNWLDALLSSIIWGPETVSGVPSQKWFLNQFDPIGTFVWGSETVSNG